MSVRNATAKDMEAVTSWRAARGLPPLDERELPPARLMALGEGPLEGVRLAFGCLIQTDTPTAIMEFVHANPARIPRELKDRAIEELLSHLLERARRRKGTKRVLALSHIPVMIERARQFGAIVSEPDYTHLLYALE